MNKVFKAVAGIAYTAIFCKRFPLNYFANRRIAVVGPASSIIGKGMGNYIDQFDIVIRFNKAPFQLKDGQFKKDLGTRTTILFHSFFENEFKGGGAINLGLYDDLGIEYVVNPIPDYFGWRGIFNFYKKYLTKRSVYIMPTVRYKELNSEFNPYRPTTGFMALYYLLQADFLELYITGFTFFKTAYSDGYRDNLKDVEVNKVFIEKEKQHCPDLEFKIFKKLFDQYNGKNVKLDDALHEIIIAENSAG